MLIAWRYCSSEYICCLHNICIDSSCSIYSSKTFRILSVPECLQSMIYLNAMALKWEKRATHLINIVSSQVKDDMDIVKTWIHLWAVYSRWANFRWIFQDSYQNLLYFFYLAAILSVNVNHEISLVTNRGYLRRMWPLLLTWINSMDE